MFKTNFSEHNKIWGDTNKMGVNAPRVCGHGQNCRQKVFHWGHHVCAGKLDILKIYI